MSSIKKFRAWDKDSKRYGEVVEIEYNELREIDGIWVWYNIHERYEPIPGANVTVEQYTGLKDKNGKEIYEGDIVDYCGECTCVIQYEDEGARFIHRDISDDFPFGFNGLGEYNGKLFEVIGNIHESNMEELCQKE